MTTPTASSSTSLLPTGGCNYNFPNLGQSSTCGCQKFSLKKKSRKRVNRSAGGRETGSGRSGASEDSEDDEVACRCGHDSCYHSGHPVVPTHATVTDHYPLQLSPQLREPLELQRVMGYGRSVARAGGRSSMAHHVHDGVMARTDRSANINVTALSAVSGTTTERDSSTSGTPMGIPKIPWTTKYNARSHDDTPKQLTDQLHNVVSHGMAGRSQTSPRVLERPPSSNSSVKEKLKRLTDYTNAIGNDQITMRERVDMMEVVPATLEDLAEKVDLIDDHVNEKLDSYEVRLKNEVDDRLGPIESFFNAQHAHGEKRKRRHQAKANLGICDNSSSLRGGDASGGKRRKRREEQDASEVTNSQQHGITTTSFTTTSYTTTTSSFGSPAPARIPQHVTDPKILSEIENLKARLLDIEVSAPPSVARPWVIEVVLIPPAPLRGIWAEAQASVPNTQYTGSEDASASTPASGKTLCSPPSGLIPFSFSVKSKVYKRLLSRGFVKRLHITGPTAREVSLSIETNFQRALEFCASYNLSRASSRATSDQYQIPSSQRTVRGNLWEPLRKIYKQVPLEFLSPSDLTSPALWMVDFLKANCIMRGTTRKTLYILPKTTTNRSNASTITWESIQKLGRYYDNDETEREQATLEEEESFWRFDAKLDSKPSSDPDPDHAAGSFFSEPFASLRPFAPESVSASGSGSVGPISEKISFSSSLAASPQLQQEATPPETVPQLQPRRSNKLNRISAHPLPLAAAEDKAVLTEDAERNPSPRRKKSPRGTNSDLLSLRTTASPPSLPLTYPHGAQRRKKKSKKPEHSIGARRSPTAEVSPSPIVAKPKGSKGSEFSLSMLLSPTAEFSPSLVAGSSGGGGFGSSFEEFMAHGVGRWRDQGPGVLHQGWDQVEGQEETTAYEFRFSDVEASKDWGPLLESPEHPDAVLEMMKHGESGVVGEEEHGDVGQTQEGDEQQEEREDEESEEEGGIEDDGEDEGEEVLDESAFPQFLGPPTPPIPLGISMVNYDGDGGYHSDA